MRTPRPAVSRSRPHLGEWTACPSCGLDAGSEREGRVQDDCQLHGLRNWRGMT